MDQVRVVDADFVDHRALAPAGGSRDARPALPPGRRRSGRPRPASIVAAGCGAARTVLRPAAARTPGPAPRGLHAQAGAAAPAARASAASRGQAADAHVRSTSQRRGASASSARHAPPRVAALADRVAWRPPSGPGAGRHPDLVEEGVHGPGPSGSRRARYRHRGPASRQGTRVSSSRSTMSRTRSRSVPGRDRLRRRLRRSLLAPIMVGSPPLRAMPRAGGSVEHLAPRLRRPAFDAVTVRRDGGRSADRHAGEVDRSAGLPGQSASRRRPRRHHREEHGPGARTRFFMARELQHDVVILGAGLAGLRAAVEISRRLPGGSTSASSPKSAHAGPLRLREGAPRRCCGPTWATRASCTRGTP